MSGHRAAATTCTVHAVAHDVGTVHAGCVGQRHRRAVRVSDHRLGGVVRQRGRRRLYPPQVVAFREGGHPHVGRPPEGLLG